eukprot:Gb_21704 [translate_table: standard]
MARNQAKKFVLKVYHETVTTICQQKTHKNHHSAINKEVRGMHGQGNVFHLTFSSTLLTNIDGFSDADNGPQTIALRIKCVRGLLTVRREMRIHFLVGGPCQVGGIVAHVRWSDRSMSDVGLGASEQSHEDNIENQSRDAQRSIDNITWSFFTLAPFWAKVFLQGLTTVAAGNPDRPVDGVNTIGMLLTSAKANTAAGYPGVSTEDEGRDPDYISLACLETRQRFRCGGVLDDQCLNSNVMSLNILMYNEAVSNWVVQQPLPPIYTLFYVVYEISKNREGRSRGRNAQGSPRFGTAPHLIESLFSSLCISHEGVHVFGHSCVITRWQTHVNMRQ